jgi:hypothetical protein
VPNNTNQINRLSHSSSTSPSQTNGNASFSFAQNGSHDLARRPPIQAQGLGGMVGIGSGAAGHLARAVLCLIILSRFQGVLQKC